MRIASWNCNCKFRSKYRPLLTAYNPDILIIPECEDPAASADAGYKAFAAEYQYRWTGRWPFKGLGVFVRPGIKVATLDWPDGGHQVFLPVQMITPDSLFWPHGRASPISRNSMTILR